MDISKWSVQSALASLALFALSASTRAVIGPGPTAVVIKGTSVELRSSVNPEGADVSVFYEATYFSSSPKPIGNGAVEVEVTETIEGLGVSGFHYVVRAVALVGETRYDGPYTTFFIPGDALQLPEGHYLQTEQGSDTLFSTEDFSFEFWFKPSGAGVLLREIDSSDPALWNHVLAEVLPEGLVKAGVRGLPSVTAGTVNFGSWNHLTLTYDNAADQFSAYLNGQPAQTSLGDRQSPREAGRNALYSFGQSGPSEFGSGGAFTGAFDEIRLWNRSLAAGRIASLYNRFGFSYVEVGHVATWTLDLFNGYSSPAQGFARFNLRYLPEAGAVPLVMADTPMTPDQRPRFQLSRPSVLGPGVVGMQASLMPNHWGAEYQFEYEQGGRTLRTPIHSLSRVDRLVSTREAITGFDIGSVYSFRFITRNSFGELISADQSFIAADWAGYALELSGDDYLATTGLTIAKNSITVELWIKPSQSGIVASFAGQSIIEIVSGSVNATLPGLETLELGQVIYDQWYHVALRYDSASRVMHGFLNGIKSRAAEGDRAPNPGSLYAFGRATTTHLGSGAPFKGQMDEIRVWHAARSDTDLTVNRWNLLVGNEAGLYLNWRLDVQSGTFAPDLREANMGRIYGTPQFVLSEAPLAFGIYEANETDGTDVEIQFVAEPDTVARLQSSSDLKEWTSHEEYPIPVSGLLRLPQQIGPNGARFFRLIRGASTP